jgi:hypothetical protein
MAKYTSGRQKNIKVGIQSYSENLTSLEVIGKVGIGTTNAASKLHIVGNTLVSGIVTADSFRGDGSQLSGINAISLISISTNTTNSNQLIPYTISFGSTIGLGATAEFVYNPSTGNFGIGTSNPTVKLDVFGDVNISGILTATDINSSSDIRLKKNIKKFENTLDKIDDIKGVSFEWKETNSKSAGIIAQDLEKVFPELVINTSEYKKVNYNGLIGVLIESIKELKEEVKDLKKRLSKLEI